MLQHAAVPYRLISCVTRYSMCLKEKMNIYRNSLAHSTAAHNYSSSKTAFLNYSKSKRISIVVRVQWIFFWKKKRMNICCRSIANTIELKCHFTVATWLLKLLRLHIFYDIFQLDRLEMDVIMHLLIANLRGKKPYHFPLK